MVGSLWAHIMAASISASKSVAIATKQAASTIVASDAARERLPTLMAAIAAMQATCHGYFDARERERLRVPLAAGAGADC